MTNRARSANKLSVTNSGGRVVGVDLGATAVRAAVLIPKVVAGRPTVSVHSLGAVPLPDGAVVNGAVVNPGTVTAALKKLWAENKIKSRRVVLGVTSQQVVVRDLKLPNLSDAQLRQTLPFKAREVIALPLDQALLDFSRIEDSDAGGSTITGLLTGIPRGPVLTAVRAVEKAKLKVARVDLAPFGLLRSIGSGGAVIEALVDIGAHLSTIVVHTNGIAQVVRVVLRGGAEWTSRLADQANLSEEEAESAKRTIGLDGESQAARALREAVRPLITEIRGSIHFFATQHRVSVERISLTGGGALLPGLVDHIAEEMGTPVTLATPMRHITDSTPSARQSTESSAVAVGLALGVAA